MQQPHSATPPLAGAFLALADPGEPADRTPSLSSVLAATAAAVVLALSAPLGVAAGPVKPSDQPAATAASKAAVPAPDDDGADGGV
jgi:hypothetical protein